MAKLGKVKGSCSWLLLLLALWSLSSRLWAGTVSGELDKSEGTLEDQFTYTLSIQGSADGEVEFPAIEGLSVERAGTSQSVSIINGKFSREVQYQFTLTPEREGTFQIPPLRVKIDGKVQETRALELKVSGGSGGESSEIEGEARTDQPVFIERAFSQTRVYVGEPIVTRVRIYHRVKLFAAEPDINYPPNFQVRNIDEQKNYSKNIDGHEYTVTELNTILTPGKPGQYSIDPAILTAKIGKSQRRRPRSWLDDWMSPAELVTKRFRSAPAEIEVLPLPLEGRRDDFSGLVGKGFELSPEISKRSIQLGETVTLTLHIRGEGSTAGMADPELRLGDRAKIYKDKPQSLDKIDLEKGIAGERVLKYAIVPSKSGKLDLGQLQLQVFDSESGQYRDLSVDLGEVEVSGDGPPQKPALQAQNSPPQGADKQERAAQEVATLGEDLVEIHSVERLEDRDVPSPFEWAAGGVLSLGSLLLFSSTFWQSQRQNGEAERAAAKRKKEALRRFTRTMSEAQTQLMQKQARAAVLAAQGGFKEYFSAKFGMKASSLTLSDILSCCERSQLRPETREEIKLVGQFFDRLLYSQDAPQQEMALNLFSRIEQLMQEVDKQC